MFDEQIINGDALYPDQERAPGVRFKIRLPWYRSLPLSCIEQVDLRIDGREVQQKDMSLTLYGINHSLDELPGLHNAWWFILDTADLHIRTRDQLPPGHHEVSVTLGCRIPYLTEGEFKEVAHCQKSLMLEEKE